MDSVINLIILQEEQLFLRKEPISVLSALIDDAFIEIGSSGSIHDKAEVIRWFKSGDQSEIQGIDFKAKYLSDDVILLTYQSITKVPGIDAPKQALRSSIWKYTDGVWKMIFHQGTPCS